MYIGLHVKYPLISDFNASLIISTDFSKNSQVSNFMKIPPVEAELFHTDGRRVRTDEANSHFSQFCENAQQISFIMTMFC
jgi:hypothetical protein